MTTNAVVSSYVSPSPKESIDASTNTSSIKSPPSNSGLHCVVNLSNESTPKHFKYTWTRMEHVEKIDDQWARKPPEDWAYECKLCTHHLQSALPLPNLSSKKLNEFHEAFTCNTKTWDFKFTNDPINFLNVLNKLSDLCQHSSVPWSQGTFWYSDDIHPLCGTNQGQDLLNIACLHCIATRENENVQKFTINIWQHFETEEEAFLTERSTYNVCVFAILLMAALPYDLKQKVLHVLNGKVRLLNDGAYLLITIYQLLFPTQDIYEMVLRMHLQKITIESCDNNYYLFTKKFLQCFQSVGPLLSVTDINKQWGAFHKQLNLHPLPDFHAKFMAALLEAFHSYHKQAHADDC